MILSEIYIYPIKSLGGISVSSSEVLPRGLKYDRRMMLIDHKNQFISQRNAPELALFKIEFQNTGFLISYKDERLSIPFDFLSNKRKRVRIWDDEVIAQSIPGTISDWFSDNLKMQCELVFMDNQSTRKVPEKYMIKDDEVSFADGFPFLLISTGSLEDLNSRLANSVPMNRFRPNLVIKSETPFIEDQLDEFEVNEVQFKAMKPCGRCMITTINQETGIASREPLRTLATYRRLDNNVIFGQNLLCLNQGNIKTGAEVKILSFKNDQSQSYPK